MDLGLAVDEAPRDDAARLPVDDDDVEHLRPRVELHLAERHLTHQRLVGPEEELLARLAELGG